MSDRLLYGNAGRWISLVSKEGTVKKDYIGQLFYRFNLSLGKVMVAKSVSEVALPAFSNSTRCSLTV